MKKGRLFIISGHSAAGKTSLMREVLDNEVLSFTTRAPRQGEIDGKDYTFLQEDDYHSLKLAGLVAEYTKYDGNYYGILSTEIDKKLEKGNAFVVVDFFGMLTLKHLYPDAVTVFMYCDYEVAESRLVQRGDSEDKVKSRMSTYYKELMNRLHYDFVIKNQGDRKTVVRILNELLFLNSY